MSQQRFIIVGWIIIAMLILNTSLSCKKSNDSPQPPTPPDFLKNLVFVQGTSSFIMGSPDGTNATIREVGRDTGEVQHEVALSPFYISKYELSRGEFTPFLLSKDTNYLELNQRKISDYTIATWNETNSHPLVNISWNTAIRYCNWLTKQTGSTDTAYIFDVDGNFNHWDTLSNGFRLPTESEWEYACRANMNTPFATGNNISTTQANYNGNFPYPGNPMGINIGRPVPVDTVTYYKNILGIEHMHGNVWELCFDQYGRYPTGKQTNPKGPTVFGTGSARVVRGGGWNNNAIYLRSANRSSRVPGFFDDYVGIRLAKSL